MLVLAGDIGGTKSRLAVYEQQSHTSLAEKWYSSQDHSSLTAVVQEFCREFRLQGAISTACLGVAGPVEHNQARLTNLPWLVIGDEISTYCQIPQVRIINDFQAAAHGIDALTTAQLVCLQEGRFDPQGNRLVIGAGTGLGVAAVVNSAQGFLPQSGEGGHMDFAPLNAIQQRLQTWLWSRWERVSYERLLSGSGLQALYAFFAELAWDDVEQWPQPEHIQQWADEGDTHAVCAVTTFVQIYAAYIGNVALLWPAYAGIYIAGGIATKIERWMLQKGFLTEMQNKGRMRGLVERMPVYLVKDQDLGLKGAMLCANQLLKNV